MRSHTHTHTHTHTHKHTLSHTHTLCLLECALSGILSATLFLSGESKSVCSSLSLFPTTLHFSFHHSLPFSLSLAYPLFVFFSHSLLSVYLRSLHLTIPLFFLPSLHPHLSIFFFLPSLHPNLSPSSLSSIRLSLSLSYNSGCVVVREAVCVITVHERERFWLSKGVLKLSQILLPSFSCRSEADAHSVHSGELRAADRSGRL